MTAESINYILFLQVWKGQGSRKWKHAHSDGFFAQFESPSLRKLLFIPSSNEKGQTLCRFISYYVLHTLIYMNISFVTIFRGDIATIKCSFWDMRIYAYNNCF